MIQQLRAAVEPDFAAVNKFVVEQLHSNVGLVESIGHYIVEAGGKRLRPLLVLLAARACGIQNEKHIALASVIEFIHTATLLHDDVVDMSTLRRGRPTVNARWNNPSSVLVGDFIYSRAFQVLVQIGDMRIMEIMADTTNRIAEGEVLQLVSKSSTDVTEATYRQVIENKTAILFQAAAHTGAILGAAEPEVELALRDYGMHLGIAFQLIDDLLDYDGDSDSLGKNVGDDLSEGKMTLPLIRALAEVEQSEAELIRNSLRAENLAAEQLQQVIAIVRRSGALEYVREQAHHEAAQARNCLDKLPPSPFRDTMATMVDFSLSRQT